MEDLFPIRQDVDYSKLIVTEEGSYSITRRRDADRILNVLRMILKIPQTMTITDATGCVGGDTINFSFLFREVFSIEISESNFRALQKNVGVFGCTNTHLIHGDSTKVFGWYTDVLYVDPPWGGPDYKTHKQLDLSMSEKRLDVWLEEVLRRKNRPKWIMLKLPANYNFNRLNFLSNVDSIQPFQIRSYILVCIQVHMPNLSKNQRGLSYTLRMFPI